MNPKNIMVHKGTLKLKGFTRFALYAQKDGRAITDGYSVNFLACNAVLVFSDNQNFVLNTMEFIPDGTQKPYRELSINGKISSSGELKFTWPEKWLELGEEHSDMLGQFRGHTGCVLSGESSLKSIVEYSGVLRGKKFFAENHAVAFQETPGTMPFFAEIVDGPIKINFMFDLEVSE